MLAVTIDRLNAFGEAWSRGNVDEIMPYFTVDCVYHASVGPEPGVTYRGTEQVRAGVIEMLMHDAGGVPRSGPAFISGDQGVAEWSYEFPNIDGSATVVRGCDIFDFAEDRIRRKDALRKTFAERSSRSVHCACRSPEGTEGLIDCRNRCLVQHRQIEIQSTEEVTGEPFRSVG